MQPPQQEDGQDENRSRSRLDRHAESGDRPESNGQGQPAPIQQARVQRQYGDEGQDQSRQDQKCIRAGIETVSHDHHGHERGGLHQQGRNQPAGRHPRHQTDRQQGEGIQCIENGSDGPQMRFGIGKHGFGHGCHVGKAMDRYQDQGDNHLDRRSRIAQVAGRMEIQQVEGIDQIGVAGQVGMPQPERPGIGAQNQDHRQIQGRQDQQRHRRPGGRIPLLFPLGLRGGLPNRFRAVFPGVHHPAPLRRR